MMMSDESQGRYPHPGFSPTEVVAGDVEGSSWKQKTSLLFPCLVTGVMIVV